MADERTLFAILEGSDKAGLGLHKRAPGDAVLGTNEAPVLGFEDKNGNFQHAPVRAAGDAASNALPVLAAKDSSNNLQYLTVDSEGSLLVSIDGGVRKSVRNTASGVPGSDVDVAALTLTVSKLYKNIEWRVSATQDTYWKLVHVNDLTEVILDDIVTGAGQYTFHSSWQNLSFTAGSSGTQSLKVVGAQLSHGKATNLYATIAVVEL